MYLRCPSCDLCVSRHFLHNEIYASSFDDLLFYVHHSRFFNNVLDITNFVFIVDKLRVEYVLVTVVDGINPAMNLL